MEDLSKVSVVILNYNTRDLLSKFIPILKKYSGNAQLVVADNASKDDSLEYIGKYHPDVVSISLPQNYGFCKGYNEALKQINTPYSVLLNSDVEVTEGWLSPLIKCIDSNPKIAACQPKIKSYIKKDEFEYAGAAGGFIDYLGYPFCRGRIFDMIETDQGQYNNVLQVFWASGACMCIRTELFKSFGGFDEDFFAHMEEIDLCWRWQLAGYKIFYTAESTVFHVGGGTLSYDNPRKAYFNFRNGLFLLYKNLPSNKLFGTLFIRMLLDGLASVKFLIDGQVKTFMAVISAHLGFYQSIPKLMRKRKLIERRQTVLSLYEKSIVVDFFGRRKKKYSNL